MEKASQLVGSLFYVRSIAVLPPCLLGLALLLRARSLADLGDGIEFHFVL